MSDTNTTDIADVQCESFPTFRRNNYFYGKLLTVNDFRMEQQYFINKQRLANRLIHGVGVVCGLQVTQDGTTTNIIVSPGVALDPCGREIVVAQPYSYSFAPNLSPTATSPAKVYIKYDFCGLDPATNVLKASNCKDNCCYSTLQEGFKIVLQNLLVLSPLHTEDICAEWNDYRSDTSKDGFCKTTCSPSNEGAVLLAEVYFTRNADGTITINQIGNSRNLVFGNGTLYNLLQCLKNEVEKDLPKVQEMNWKHGNTFTDSQLWRDRLFSNEGFLVVFDRLMDTATINEDTVSLTLECYSNNRRRNPFIEKKDLAITPACSAVGLLPAKKTIARVHLDLNVFGENAPQYFGPEISKNYSKLRLVIRIKGDCVLDNDGKSLDGDLLGGKLPTGDSSEGGLFESWIILNVPVETSMTFDTTPATITAGQSLSINGSITPAPPTSADAFHSIKLTLIDPAGNAIQQGTYNSDGSGKFSIPNVAFSTVGTYTIKVDYSGELFASANVNYMACTASNPLVVKAPTNTSIIKIAANPPKVTTGYPVTIAVAVTAPPKGTILHGITLDVTNPENKKITKGPNNSDSTGKLSFQLAGEETVVAGNYTLQVNYPGETFTTNDVYKGSTKQASLMINATIN